MKKLRKARWLPFILAMAFALTLGLGCAATKKKVQAKKAFPEKPYFYKQENLVDLAFVEKYVQIPAREDVLIVDTRPKGKKYDKGHIPSAISIPNSKFDKFTDKLPKDKNQLIIYYCGGFK